MLRPSAVVIILLAAATPLAAQHAAVHEAGPEPHEIELLGARGMHAGEHFAAFGVDYTYYPNAHFGFGVTGDVLFETVHATVVGVQASLVPIPSARLRLFGAPVLEFADGAHDWGVRTGASIALPVGGPQSIGLLGEGEFVHGERTWMIGATMGFGFGHRKPHEAVAEHAAREAPKAAVH